MTDIADTVAELAGLWHALAAALARDTATPDGPAPRQWSAAAVVNPDVLTAIMVLDRELPAAVHAACQDIGERWRPRDTDGCLLQLPRLAGRMRDLGHVAAEQHLTWQAAGWLRMVKRALGLRKPDVPLGHACPRAGTYPECHPHASELIWAAPEGFLNPDGDGGLQVEWVGTERVYCASEECGAWWPHTQWTHLMHLVEQAQAEAAA
jgi:hypothetical protein